MPVISLADWHSAVEHMTEEDFSDTLDAIWDGLDLSLMAAAL